MKALIGLVIWIAALGLICYWIIGGVKREPDEHRDAGV